MTPSLTDEQIATELWRRLARPFVLVEVVDALLGLSPAVVNQLAGVVIGTCQEAGALLDNAPGLLRSLTTSVATVSVRSRGEVRGPILWSETMSARAATSGDVDVFVCKAPQRDYDTPENQVLVKSLMCIADAGQAAEAVDESEYDDAMLRLVRARARMARKYLEHPALSKVNRALIKGRTIKRAQGGKRGAKYSDAFAMLARNAEPLGVRDLLPFCDRRTRLQHRVLVGILNEVESRGLRVPALRVEGGVLLGGPITYIHPRRRSSRDYLHGIMVGEVLIDVPERFRGATVERARESLAARAGGRVSVLVQGESEISAALDVVITQARHRTAKLALNQ